MLNFDNFYDLMAEDFENVNVYSELFLYEELFERYLEEQEEIEILVDAYYQSVEDKKKAIAEYQKLKKEQKYEKELKNKQITSYISKEFPTYIENTPTAYNSTLSVSQPVFCEEFCKKNIFLRTKALNNVSLHKYNGIFFEEMFDSTLFTLIQEELIPWNKKARAQGLKSFVTDRSIFALVTFLKHYHEIEDVEIEDFNYFESKIALNDCVLDIRTGETEEHSPSFRFTRKLDIDFTAKIPATPVFDKYIQDLCTIPESNEIDTGLGVFLQEFVGAVLSNVSGWKYKQFLFMCGAGNTGKSRLKLLTEKILGKKYHAETKLKQLQEDRFTTVKLHGKRLAGEGDMSVSRAAELSIIKLITGGDTISGERKGVDSFDFIYQGFLWFTSNELLKFGGDKGEHVYKRFLLCEFNNKITIQNKNIVNDMYEERQGVVLKCLYLAGKTMDNYEFTVCDSMRNNIKKLQTENSSALQFFEKYCDMRENTTDCADMLKHDHIYLIYKEFQKSSGEKYTESKKDFEKNLATFLGKKVDEIKGMYRNNVLKTGNFRSYVVKPNLRAYEELNIIYLLENTRESCKIDTEHKQRLVAIYNKKKSEEIAIDIDEDTNLCSEEIVNAINEALFSRKTVQ